MKSSNNVKKLRTIAYAVSISGIILSVLVLVYGGTVEEWRTSFGHTYSSNELALVLVSSLPFSFFFFRKSHKVFKAFWLIGSCLTINGIIGTGSRGGFIGFCAVAILIVFGFSRRNLIPKMLIILLAAGAMVFFAPDQYWERMATITHYEYDASAYVRQDVWQKGLEFMMDNPFVGVGVDGFTTAEGETHLDRGGEWFTAHNSFIQIGAEIGIGGLICFVVIFYFIIKRLKKMSQNPVEDQVNDFAVGLANTCRISLIGFIVCGFFLSQAYSPFLYDLLGLSLAVSAVSKDFKKDSYTMEGTGT